jgi:hypothetical protein
LNITIIKKEAQVVVIGKATPNKLINMDAITTVIRVAIVFATLRFHYDL